MGTPASAAAGGDSQMRLRCFRFRVEAQFDSERIENGTEALNFLQGICDSRQTTTRPSFSCRLFFLRENSLSTAPFYGHLVFRGVECKDCRTLDLEFILGCRFKGDRG